MKILLTGGGTGGHIYPLVSVAKKLKQPAEIRYYGPNSSYNNYLTSENIVVKKILGAKFRRYWSWLSFIDLVKIPISIIQSLLKVALFMPDVAFSKGGTGALPVLLACWIYGIPIIIHESDTVPGITNRLSGRMAKKIELGWDYTKKYFPNKNTSVVGIPLRDEIVNGKINKPEAKKSFGFKENDFVVLILGGSQGSQRINSFILKNLELFLSKFQILHQVGSANYKNWPENVTEKYKAFAFFENNIGAAYSAADLIISRSGSSIFEIAFFEKPSILIPLPESANNHQKINAYEYIKNGAGIVMEENNLSAKTFLNQIEKILSDKNLYNQMSSAAKLFAKPDAAKIIAEDILAVDNLI
ncbi:MAG: UDP-N-acetylglucosamine--N-acetylmuramyl-(pentapeptide) pyrophosphoryl-undecaprenol N-acetylglucosamine transferase [Patescibacteria group bacterium]